MSAPVPPTNVAPTGAALTAEHSKHQAYLTILEASRDTQDKTLVVRDVAPGVTTFSIPFARFALIPIGGRSTAIKHSSGDILLYASHPHTAATAEILAGLGKVRWLVTPDGEHTMHIQTYVKAYPEAQAIGVPRCKDKYPEIKWAGLIGAGGEAQTYGFEDEIEIHRVSSHTNDELVLFHKPTATLLEADMLFNLPPTEQYSRNGGLPSLMKFFGGGKAMSPDGGLHDKMAGAVAKDKEWVF